MSSILFTGFPGMLGSELLPRVVLRSPGASVACLVQRKYARLAKSRLEQIGLSHPEVPSRVQLVEGDITLADLGLGERAGDLSSQTTEIYHLAAIYDLAVKRELAFRVNVLGTRHLLAFADACPALARFHYMSTCYVSGRYSGIFAEGDLGKGQEFNNSYEETKFLAEVDVQERMGRGLPATVYRPSIVVGDSRTGETQKYDGPYPVIRWMLRQPRLAIMPVVGRPHQVRANFVPRDFVVDAVAYLSGLPHSVGRVYQLADPEPQTMAEVLRGLARATGKRLIHVRVPGALARWALEEVPGLQRVVGASAEMLDYFVHPTHYTTFHTQADLEGSEIRVPRLSDYVDRLVAFVRDHPEIGSEAMA